MVLSSGIQHCFCRKLYRGLRGHLNSSGTNTLTDFSLNCVLGFLMFCLLQVLLGPAVTPRADLFLCLCTYSSFFPLNNSVTVWIVSKLGCAAGAVQREMNHDIHGHTLLLGAKHNLRLAGRTGITWNFRDVEWNSLWSAVYDDNEWLHLSLIFLFSSTL